MRVAPPPAGSFSDDSDGDAGAWPLAASTSRRRDASDDADDLRQMLDAAEAARAALREVASSAAAEREMAFEARDAADGRSGRGSERPARRHRVGGRRDVKREGRHAGQGAVRARESGRSGRGFYLERSDDEAGGEVSTDTT